MLGHKPTDVADQYGPVHITPAEAELILSKSNSVEEEIAEILITAKLRSGEGELEVMVDLPSPASRAN